jgi:hypothetical protein
LSFLEVSAFFMRAPTGSDRAISTAHNSFQQCMRTIDTVRSYRWALKRQDVTTRSRPIRAAGAPPSVSGSGPVARPSARRRACSRSPACAWRR